MSGKYGMVAAMAVICAISVVSCATSPETGSAVEVQPVVNAGPGQADESVLVSDEQLAMEYGYSLRADELFDDFLYNYVHDIELRSVRTHFPLEMTTAGGEKFTMMQDEWFDNFDFMCGDYTTNLYNNEQEMSINEDTTLMNASLEKIDLNGRTITTYEFIRVGGLWTMHAVNTADFRKSDLYSFLDFYSRFSQDSTFQYQSVARSISISIQDPDDESQSVDGFITPDQWSSMNSGVPQGIITNIRYGQSFKRAKKIWLEKISMGNGMSEMFVFCKRGRNWKLERYEN